MTETHKRIMIYTTELDCFGVFAAANTDNVAEAMIKIFTAITDYINLTAEGSVSLIEPQVNEAYGHGRVWSVSWFGGPFGWAEAYAVSEGSSNMALVSYALTPCVLAIEALN